MNSYLAALTHTKADRLYLFVSLLLNLYLGLAQRLQKIAIWFALF